MKPVRPVTISPSIKGPQPVPPTGVRPPSVSLTAASGTHDQMPHARLLAPRVPTGTTGAPDQLAQMGVPQRLQAVSIHDNLKNSISSNVTQQALIAEQYQRPAVKGGYATEQLKQPIAASNVQHREQRSVIEQLKQPIAASNVQHSNVQPIAANNVQHREQKSVIEHKKEKLQQSLSRNQALQREIKALEAELAQNFPSVPEKEVLSAEKQRFPIEERQVTSLQHSRPARPTDPVTCHRLSFPQAPHGDVNLADKKQRAQEKARELQSELEGLAAELSEITAFAQSSQQQCAQPKWQSPALAVPVPKEPEVSIPGSHEIATLPRRSLPQGVVIPLLAIPHPKEHQPTPSTSSSEGVGPVREKREAGATWMGLGDAGAEAFLLAHGGRAVWRGDNTERTIDHSEARGARVPQPDPRPTAAVPQAEGNDDLRCPMCGRIFQTALEAELHLDKCAEAATFRTLTQR